VPKRLARVTAAVIAVVAIAAALAPQTEAAASVGASQVAASVAAPEAIVQKVANVVYKSVGPLQIRLDIYIPTGPGMTGPFPGLLLIHGGGWADGTRADVASYAQDFASMGFVSYAVDFRESCDPLNPGPGDDPSLCGYTFPTPEEDLRDAIVWIRTNAPLHPEWKTMPDRVGMWGTSSGANITGSVATGWNLTGGPEGTPGWDKPDAWAEWAGAMQNVPDGTGEPAQPDRIKAYLGCDPYATPSTCADPDILAKMSPLNNLTLDDPPAFLMGATQDPLLPVEDHAVAMHDAMQALGLPSDLYIVDGACHGLKCNVLDPNLEPATADWLHSILGPKQPTVTVSSGPDPTTPLGQATFEFTAAAGVTIRCSLDGAPLSICTSPVTYPNLSVGPHSFTAQGTDGSNVTGDPSIYLWTISPRSITISNSGFNPAKLSSVIRGSWVEWTNNGSAPHNVTDSSGMSLFASGSIAPGQKFRQRFQAAGIYPYASAGDKGMTGKVQVPVAISPTTVPPGQPYTVTWATQTASAGYVYDAQYKTPTGTKWKAWQSGVTSPSAVVTTSQSTAEGDWKYRARLRNTATSSSSTWSVVTHVTVTSADTTPPIVTITSGPPPSGTATSATFGYAANESATFACSLDGAAAQSCPSGGVTYSSLAAGGHTFSVQGTDTAGNVSTPATWTWYVSNLSSATVSNSGFSPGTVTIPFGTTVEWTNTGTNPHTVTDISPVALFDSGQIAPGGTFRFFFNGASTYTVGSTPDPGKTQTIRVPPRVSPASGTTATPFTVSWAAIPPPPTLLFDVYVKRPGTSTYDLLELGATGTSTQFVPDGGPGTYSFAIRLRDLADVTEGYSPAVSISVGP
jgi:plastocyanin/acetyl esterase/lipase